MNGIYQYRDLKTDEIVSEETRKRMSNAQTGRVVSNETRQKLKEVNTLKYYRLIKAGKRKDKQQY